jgi:hypothetical protein
MLLTANGQPRKIINDKAHNTYGVTGLPIALQIYSFLANYENVQRQVKASKLTTHTISRSRLSGQLFRKPHPMRIIFQRPATHEAA